MKVLIMFLVYVLGACCSAPAEEQVINHTRGLALAQPDSIVFASPELGPNRACVATCLLQLGYVKRARIRNSQDCGVHVVPGETWVVNHDGCRLIIEVGEEVLDDDVCGYVVMAYELELGLEPTEWP